MNHQPNNPASNQAPTEVDARVIDVGGQKLMVAIRHGASPRPPLLLFNGIGANWELARPFLSALTDTTAIIFDMPGIGGSPLPTLPYRPSNISRLAARLLAILGYEKADIAGVSCSSPINTRKFADGWCSPRPRPGRSWFPVVPKLF
jgi:pimeloyl-ACP methyl ester carboxylesterase